jgi:Ca2+-binding RTX toxin-like protein
MGNEMAFTLEDEIKRLDKYFSDLDSGRLSQMSDFSFKSGRSVHHEADTRNWVSDFAKLGWTPTQPTPSRFGVHVANVSETSVAGDGNDIITGTSGADVLNGGGGNDTLIGGAGPTR